MMVVRPSVGGAFGHVRGLAEGLAREGHEVAIAGPHGSRVGASRTPIIAVEMGREVEPWRDARAVASIARAVGAFKPDLVHAHGSKAGVVARLARVRHPTVPVVFTPHNYAFTNWFESGVRRGAYRAIETSLAPLASRVLCVCEAEAAQARKVGPDSRVRVVHNGIEPLLPQQDPGFRQELGIAGPMLLAVTEYQPAKGIPTLLEAMPLVRERVPDAQLVIAGDGPDRGAAEARIASLDMGDAVELLGLSDRVPALLQATDVFVSAGWSESFPYAILEAMSLARPIVATDVGGVGEAIEDGVTGRLVEPRSAAALAAGIADVLEDRRRAEALGEAARERMLARFTFDRMLAGTRSVYAEVGLR
jgi:glycosyltransferase involved in cell wall biosynthesis